MGKINEIFVKERQNLKDQIIKAILNIGVVKQVVELYIPALGWNINFETKKIDENYSELGPDPIHSYSLDDLIELHKELEDM